MSRTGIVIGLVLAGTAALAQHFDRFAQLPLAIEPMDAGRFVARAGALSLVLSATDATLGAQGMRLEGADASAAGVLEAPLPGRTHYLIGNDPRRWRTNVPNYARLRFRNVYPGIDLVYYGDRRDLEFDFVVAPGANPDRIRMALSGPQVQLSKLRIYQGNGTIAGRTLRRRNRVAFHLAAYDRSRPLVIDPVLSFASLFGGGSADNGAAVAVDVAGSIYVSGSTSSANFPLAAAFLSGVNPNRHMFIAKLSADGTRLLYSTYLGGSGTESSGGIAADAGGSTYVGGVTTSTDFPGANNAPPPDSAAGSQAFAAKLSPDGSKLLYSTYVGQRPETGGAFVVDPAGNAYITHGSSVTRLSNSGTEVYSTSLPVTPFCLAVDAAGNAYTAGTTTATDLTTRNALQSAQHGLSNLFVVKLDSHGDVVYATYLGGSGMDSARDIAADRDGNAYLAGNTTSADFPGAAGPQSTLATPIFYKSQDGANWNRSDFGLGTSPSLLAVDPVNASNLYALGNGHLYRSASAGGTWSLSLPANIQSFAISLSAPSTLYASRRDSNQSGAVLRSTDGGATWSTLSTQKFTFSVMAVDPKNSSVIYAGERGTGNNDGFYKSTDGGATWNARDFLGQGNGVRDLVATSSRLYLVLGAAAESGGSRLFTSTDQGENWTQINPSPDVAMEKILVDPRDSSILFAIAFYRLGGASVVFRSTDGGATFVRAGDLSGVNALASATGSPSVLYAATNTGVYRSTDSGDHWDAANNGISAANVLALAVDAATPPTVYAAVAGDTDGFIAKLDPSGSQLIYSTYLGGHGADSMNAIAVGADGSAYVTGTTAAADFPVKDGFRTRVGGSDGFISRLSPDGSSLIWSSFLGGATAAGIATGSDGSMYLAGTSSTVAFPTSGSIQPFVTDTLYRTVDGGATWTAGFTSSAVLSLAISPKAPSNVYAATAAGAFLISKDKGVSWSPAAVSSFFRTVLVDPSDPATVYAAAGTTFYRSTNSGATWTNARVGNVNVNALAADPKAQSTLYAATTGGVYKSTDAGSTWARVGSDTTSALSLVIDPQNSSTLYAAGPAIRKSTDAGATWSVSSSGIPAGVTIATLAIDPYNPLVLYAAGSGGVFRSYDGAASWTAQNQGLRLPPGSGVASLVVAQANASILYAAVPGGGVHVSTDHGDHWTRLPLEVSLVQALAVDPTNPAIVYAGAISNPSDAFVARIVQ